MTPRRATVSEIAALVQVLTAGHRRYKNTVSRLMNVPVTDLDAISYVDQCGRRQLEVSQSDLTRELDRSGPAVSAMVDRLEAAGHMMRRQSEHDRRKMLVTLTRSARGQGEALFRPLVETTDGALDKISDDDLRLVIDVLQRLVEATERAERELRSETRRP